MSLQRPLSPNTAEQYRRILTRALGPAVDSPSLPPVVDVTTWPESSRRLLRAALRHWAAERGQDPAPLVAQVPKRYEIRKVKRFPSEEEALRYEAAARGLPLGVRALALLPLAMGLRASSLLAVTRQDIERALGGADEGKLKVYLKGGEERLFPARHVHGLLHELLGLPAALPSLPLAERRKPPTPAKWETVGQMLSAGPQIVQYHKLRELVRETGEKVGLQNLRPHLLRHVFASRLHRDGAPVAAIQWLMGHRNMATTMLYLHEDGSSVTKWLRQF